MPVPQSAAPDTTLDMLPLRVAATVRDVHERYPGSDWAQRLAEIGFIPGERVMLMARGLFGGDPLVVRVGTSTFALRRAEAGCVRVDGQGAADTGVAAAHGGRSGPA